MTDLMKNMDRLFEPKTVAVVGASANPDKLGFHVMKSLVRGGFAGRIIPVNPSGAEIMGLPTAASLADHRGEIDLVIVVVPAGGVREVFAECAGRDVAGIVLITAGFKEIDDPAGAELHEELLAALAGKPIAVIGPNTYGFVNLIADLNASFTPEFSSLKKGSLAIVTQSGGISHLLGFLAQEAGLGVSKIVGLGNRLNVDFPEMIAYLMEDHHTKVIVCYLEGMENPRKLVETARRYRGKKPILVYKAGKAKIGNRASLSHTGTLAGRTELYRGAFRQAGMLEIDDLATLLDTARALSVCPLPAGPGVAILSGQAGCGMVAADVCEAEGLNVISFSKATQERINELMPPIAYRNNPVDMGPAWYDAARMQMIVQAAMEDEQVDMIILLMMFASANVAVLAGIQDLLRDWRQRKPLISCLLAPPGIWEKEINYLQGQGALVNYPTPERAVRAAANLWRLRALNLKA